MEVLNEQNKPENVDFRTSLLAEAITYGWLLLVALVLPRLNGQFAQTASLSWLNVAAVLILQTVVIYLPLYGAGVLLKKARPLKNQPEKEETWLKLVLSLAEGFLTLLGLYLITSWLSTSWWLIPASFSFVVLAFQQIVVPLFMNPDDFFKPLKNPELLERFESLAAGTGFSSGNTYISDREESKNMMMQLMTRKGRTVLIGEELLEVATLDELECLFVHELKHVISYDSVRKGLLAFVATFTCIALIPWVLPYFGISSVGNIANLPVLLFALCLAKRLASVMVSAICHLVERQADWYAIEKTRKPEVFKSSLIKCHRVLGIPEDFSVLATYLYGQHDRLQDRLSLADIWQANQA